jgi:hypothetical protein
VPYFHSSRAELSVGTVIAPYQLPTKIPSAWALLNDEVAAGPNRAMRVLKAVARDLRSPFKGSAFIDVVAERVRVEQFPGLPSRNSCSFAMPTLPAALAYSAKFQQAQHVFEVQPVGTPRIWFGDMEVLSLGANLDADPVAEYQAVLDRLATYWRGLTQDPGSITSKTEVLIEGSIGIVGPCLAPR